MKSSHIPVSIRVLLADDLNIALLGINLVLDSLHEVEVVGCCQTLNAVLDQFHKHQPQIVITSERLDPEVLVTQIAQ